VLVPLLGLIGRREADGEKIKKDYEKKWENTNAPRLALDNTDIDGAIVSKDVTSGFATCVISVKLQEINTTPSSISTSPPTRI